jgi:hypothetical protein
VIVSDDAGQFRIGSHALCWIHAERLVHELIPFNDRQRRAIELVRQLIWWFSGGDRAAISSSFRSNMHHFESQL